MAFSPRHLPLAAGCRRHRAYPFSASHGARLHQTFGTQELSQAALAALQDRKACLLANHGVIATGADVQGAVTLAGEVENLATQYCAALALGEVRILDETEMRRVLEKFRSYGQQDASDPDLRFGG